MTTCFLAPSDWQPSAANPFAAEGSYRAGWSCFRLTASDDDWIRNGCEASGLYVVSFGRRCAGLAQRLADFLRYESAHSRRVILAGDGAEALLREAQALEFVPTTVRGADPWWLVHSTTAEAWAQIEACGELRSFASLREHGQRAIGEVLLNDPPDYAEYVALGQGEKIGPEFVVACRQAGRMLPNPETEYEPGVRLYFEAHRIIRDGLGVRDGLHPLKVRGCLPLQPYLLAAIGPADLSSLPPGQDWTTTLFLARANEAFYRIIPQSLR